MLFPRGSMLWRLGEVTNFTVYSEYTVPSSLDVERQSRAEAISQPQQHMHQLDQKPLNTSQQMQQQQQHQQQHTETAPAKALSTKLHRPDGVALPPDAWGRRGYWDEPA